jgi:ankyrin repeat protein
MLNKDIITISLAELEQHLKDGMLPDNSTEPFKNSPLCFACMYNRTDIAQLLIDAGADVNFPGFHGRTPLFYVADKGNVELAEALYKKGADVNYINKDGKNILMDIAIHKPGKEIVEWLINHGANINYRFSKYAGEAARLFISRAEYNKHRSVLNNAVMCGAIEMVKLLVQHGADGATNGWHQDAFLLSLESETDEIADWFLQNHQIQYPDHLWLPKAIDIATVYKKERIKNVLMQAQVYPINTDDVYKLDAKRVEKFLSDGFPPDNESQYGNDSPLCHACMYNKADIAKLLIEAGADVNFKGAYGRTPLMYAAGKNNLDICELLLEKGADINATNEGGDNILMDYDKLSEETIKWLIAKGIDINYRNEKRNWTVLQSANTYGNPALVKILIEQGADGTNNGWNEKSFIESLQRQDEELSLYFLQHYKGRGVPGGISALIRAINFKKNHTATKMLKCATEEEKKSWEKEKSLGEALVDASYQGNLEMCKLLLDLQVNVNSTHYLDTPLHNASQCGYTDIAKLLISYGAEVDKRGYEENTALILAASKGHIETIKILLEAGAAISAKNKMGWTALMQAALFWQTDTMKYLLDHGANANDKAENERNITTLMLACDSGKKESVELLLEYGADPYARDDIGLTAHQYAEWAIPFKFEIYKLLPPLPVSNEPELPLPKVDLKDCPICKGIGQYESRQVSGFGEDFRKYFFKVMTLLEEGPEIHEDYKYYTRTSYYQCPRCDSKYKKRESEDMDNIPTRYDLEVWRISGTEIIKT